MQILASTNIFTVLGGLSSTLPMLYVASTGTISTIGYPTLGLTARSS